MNYADELVSMLRPLGVYSFQEGSFSLAELQALGAALDAADEAFGAAQKGFCENLHIRQDHRGQAL